MFKLTQMKLITLTTILLAMLLTACSEQQQNTAPVNQESAISSSNDANAAIDATTGWPKVIRQEVYGDAETFSRPRLQFMAKLPNEAKSTLWSMRMDGSDRRRVADEALLYDGKEVVLHTPSRSPNNRYVALSMDNAKTGFYRAILDLKTQEKIKIMDGGGVPKFNWTSDSENLIFASEVILYNYHLPSRTLTKRPMINNQRLFLLPDDSTFVAMNYDGYSLYDFAGNLINKHVVELDEEQEIGDPTISPDGKLLVYYVSGGKEIRLHWLDIQSGESLGNDNAKKILSSLYEPMFSYQDSTLFTPSYDFKYINLKTMEKEVVKRKELRIWDMKKMAKLSLINYRSVK